MQHSLSAEQAGKFLIIISGPTAIGKTSVAIEVAKHFNTEIISADSRQLFKEMNIGVARPTETELNNVPHHFIANKSVEEYVSAGEYEREAIALLDELFKKKDVLVMCGGTGFYINAVCNGFDEIPEVDASIREQLNNDLEVLGLESLQERLKELDIDTYNSMDIQNSQRVVRALEVCIGTGQPFSFFKQQRKIQRNFIPVKIGLNTEREKLYRNIDHRVDEMIKHGLVEEAKTLLPYKDNNALKTVGYQELFEYFAQEVSLEDAIKKIKQNTRNYAKRQLTWFRRDKDVKWFEPSQIQEIIDYLHDVIK
jgi:tRNA dimethylallyltransferase